MSKQSAPAPMPAAPKQPEVKPMGESGSKAPVTESNEPNIDPKPQHESVETKIANSIKVMPEVEGGIEVMAINDGFFRNHRKKPGDMFKIPSIDKVGRWMKCIEPHWEKEKEKFLKDKIKYLEEKGR